MSSQFGFIDIILLAMFAGFIILRLRNILGRKTGHQGKPMNRYFPKGMEVLKDIENNEAIKEGNIDEETKRVFLKGAELAYEQIISGDFTAALENLQIARQLAIDSNNRVQEAESYRREGIIYNLIGQYPNALTMYSKSIELHTQENSPRLLYSIDSVLNIYEFLGQYDQLIEYSWILLEKSLARSSYDDAASAHHHLGFIVAI